MVVDPAIAIVESANGAFVEERHLTSEQLADRERVPVETVAYWRRHGLGPDYIRVGRYVRYRESDVIRWEDGRLVRAGARGAASE